MDNQNIIKESFFDTLVRAIVPKSIQDKVDAKDQLQANRTFCQKELTAYIQQTYPGFVFNAVKCERKEGGKRERERKGSEERSVRISCAVAISENDVGKSCNRRKGKAQRNFSMAK